MILAAGFGKRMMPLTAKTPKPLLPVNGKPLIQYHIERLCAVGIKELVINVSHLGGQIENYCGDGSRFGVRIEYSRESEPLETAGGIAKALPLLIAEGGSQTFVVVNADVWTDYGFSRLLEKKLAPALAHLIMVANPQHNPDGDFALEDSGMLASEGPTKLTYSGVALLDRALFDHYQVYQGALAPLLRKAMADLRVSGEYYGGHWYDIGTPDRLEEVSCMVANQLKSAL